MVCVHSLFHELLPIELRMQNVQNACKTQRCEQLQYITYGGLLDNVEWKTYFPNLIVRSSLCFSHSTPCAFRPSFLPRAENHKQRRQIPCRPRLLKSKPLLALYFTTVLLCEPTRIKSMHTLYWRFQHSQFRQFSLHIPIDCISMTFPSICSQKR